MNQSSSIAFEKLERGVFTALQTYSNVHRGSGQFSVVTTSLFEQTREIVLDYLRLSGSGYHVVFCSPIGARNLESQLQPSSFRSIRSSDISLPLGVVALAVKKSVLRKVKKFNAGGGTARLISREWVIWEKSPARFEPGTPAVMNIIAFAVALKLTRQYGEDVFSDPSNEIRQPSGIGDDDVPVNLSGKALLEELRKGLIGMNVQVPTMHGMSPYVNLDNSASTSAFRPVWETVCRTWRSPVAERKNIVEKTKGICSRVLGAPQQTYEIIFTSNTTEAINLVAGVSGTIDDDTEPVALTSIGEHNSNDLPWRVVAGLPLVRIPVDRDGVLDLAVLQNMLKEYNRDKKHGRKKITIVALCGASNVLGLYHDLKEIGRIVHEYGTRLLVDGAQMVAHRKVRIEENGIDYFAFSAHKVYAPFGSGAMIVKKEMLQLSADKLEVLRSSGEENLVGIAALGKALSLLERVGPEVVWEEEQELTRYALAKLSLIRGIRIFGVNETTSPLMERKGGIILFELKSALSFKIAKQLAYRSGIGVRFGCHCAHLLIKKLLSVPPWAEQIQRMLVLVIPGMKLPGVTRASLGIGNTREDIDLLVSTLKRIAAKQNEYERNSQLTGKSTLFSSSAVKQQIAKFVKETSAQVFG